MKKIVSLLLSIVMMAGMVVTLASCGAPADDGAQIKVYLGDEMYDFDPTDYYADSNAEQVMSLLFEPLFRYNENGVLECAAAQSYTVDTVERQIVIELRESYWSDNTRVKAEDFVYAWCEKLLNPNNPTPAAALLYDIENALAVKSGMAGSTTADIGVSATGAYQLTIKYREGADYMQLLRNLASVATAPVRQSYVSKTPTYWSKFTNTLCSNGPFELRKYSTLTSEITLARNKGYHQDPTVVDYDNQVTPGELVGFVTGAGEAITTSYADIENKVVFYLLDAPVADRAANATKATVKDDTSVYSYVFNTEKALFKDAKVRKALSLALDRAAIVAAVSSGKAADGFLPDVSGGSAEAFIASGADMAAAEQLLSEVDFTGITKSFKLSVADNEESRIIAEMVEAAWEELGFKVTINYVEPVFTKLPGETADAPDVEILDSGIQVLLKEASFGIRDFDVLALDWQTYSNDPFVALAAFSGTFSGCGYGRASVSGWSDAQYDYLISAAYRATGAERKAALEAAEEYLCEASPIVPIMFNQNTAFVSGELSGIRYDAFGNAIFTKVAQRNYQSYFEEE